MTIDEIKTPNDILTFMNENIKYGWLDIYDKEHIHLLVSCPPSLSVSKLVQQLKGKTSRVLLNENRILKKRYWGQHLWASGYFCRSVGTVTQNTIKDYIENQSDEYEENFRIIG